MPPASHFYRTSWPCPCCGREVEIYGWEAAMLGLVFGELYGVNTGRKAAPKVVCVNARGHQVREGYAVTYQCCGGLVNIGIFPQWRAWKRGTGWWWPLDRVLWATEKE